MKGCKKEFEYDIAKLIKSSKAMGMSLAKFLIEADFLETRNNV